MMVEGGVKGGAGGRVGLILALQAAESVDAVLHRSAHASCCMKCSQQVVLKTPSQSLFTLKTWLLLVYLVHCHLPQKHSCWACLHDM